MKRYCVVYLSAGGIHYRYRCAANSKGEAKRMCKENIGVKNTDIVDVYTEDL